ncbi:Apoptosis-inducing factor 2 [Candida viswanathii]|jgi:NADH dehydrogenase FAD-containing subunit|uniref:Apoptosis-inducing factor 2 n=1 Tax=Candida viswanathii TaxID=5486 RepID=A0A367YND9_9ASCO|nr:Apoptosis-inducing factor 2 [Candida viswanathii]
MTKESKKVVIIGGSYAAFMALKSLVKSSKVKLDITLIATSNVAFFNAASPRLLVEPEHIDKTVFSIPESIKKLANGTIHTISYYKGYVTKVDLDQQVVYVGETEFEYDNLVIASGARTKAGAFKLDNKRDETYTIDAIKNLAANIKKAKSVAVIGGGSTGVETAAEIAYAYRDKSVVLYTGSSGPLSAFSSPRTTSGATSKLKDLGVTIVNDTRVGTEGNVVVLPDGARKEYDLVIEAVGTTPNSEFLPSKVLNDAGFVETDKHLRLKNYSNVIVAGDVVAEATGTIVNLKFDQEPVLAKTLQYEVCDDKSVKLKAYLKPTSVTTFTPIGKEGGVGLMFGWTVPSFLVKVMKSKDFMISKGADNF